MNNALLTRKQGWVSGFIAGDIAYIDSIRRDFDLDCTTGTLMYIRSIFASMQREPTVSELYFFVEAINSGCKLDTAVRVQKMTASDGAVCELFAGLVRRYSHGTTAADTLPPLTALAACAVTTDAGEIPFPVSVSRESDNEFPAYPGSAPVTVTAGGYRLTVGKQLSFSAPITGDSAPLLYPPEGMDYDEFVRHACKVIAAQLLRDPRCVPVALTSRGLLRDIAAVCPAAHINCALLPGGNGCPESVFASYAPGVLLFTDKKLLPALAADAESAGIRLVAAVTKAPSGSGFSITGSGAPINVNAQLLRTLEFVRPVTLAAMPGSLRGDGELTLSSTEESAIISSPDKKHITVGDTEISAISVTGDSAYDALAAALGGEGIFAVCGTLAPDDAVCVPVILALDAVCRNLSPKVAACRFSLGGSTSVTVFRLSRADI